MFGHTSMQNGDKMTVQETSAFFGGAISAYTLRKLVREGKLPACYVGGQIIFSRNELDKWFTEKSRANVERPKSQRYGGLRVVGQ